MCFVIVSVASPMVPGGMRNIHDSKVSGQMASNSANHNSSEDYMGMVHRPMGSGVSLPHHSAITLDYVYCWSQHRTLVHLILQTQGTCHYSQPCLAP